MDSLTADVSHAEPIPPLNERRRGIGWDDEIGVESADPIRHREHVTVEHHAAPSRGHRCCIPSEWRASWSRRHVRLLEGHDCHPGRDMDGTVQVIDAEHNVSLRGDVNRVDVDVGLRHHEHQVTKHARLVQYLDDKYLDRKSTRLNSSHGYISYAVFCLKKKTKNL